MGASRRRLTGIPVRLCLCAALAALTPSCATLTGIATGAITGVVDGPAQVARKYSDAYDKHPEYWTVNILILGPLSLAFGPVFGMIKGIAVDVQWLRDETTYGDAYLTYGPASIWRPYTIHW